MSGSLRPLATVIASLIATTSLTVADTPWGAAFGKGEKKLPPGEGESEERPATPPPSAPAPRSRPQPAAAQQQARADAESLVATFNAAHEAGATAFSRMRSTREVVAALSTGVKGAGRYADTIFRVPGLDAHRQAAAERYLAVERGRIVVRQPGAAVTTTTPPIAIDPRTAFADGKLLVEVPSGFASTHAENGDLVLRSGKATVTLHLEASTDGLDAWGEVRAASDRTGISVSMSGKKIYLIEPDRRAPERVVVGFGKTLVSMEIKAAEADDAALTAIRFALPKIIGSLGVVAG